MKMRATLPWWVDDLEKALAKASCDTMKPWGALNLAAATYDDFTNCDNAFGASQEQNHAKHDFGAPDYETNKAVVAAAPERKHAKHLFVADHENTASNIMNSNIPVPPKLSEQHTHDKKFTESTANVTPCERLQHSSLLSQWLLNTKRTEQLLRNCRILIVGGGQTSAHLAQLALEKGARKVMLCSRRKITRKPYDVDVAFVGDRRPKFLEKFWQLDDFQKRKEFNANLRNGGSMSADMYNNLVEKSSSPNNLRSPFDKKPSEKKKRRKTGRHHPPRHINKSPENTTCSTPALNKKYNLLQPKEQEFSTFLVASGPPKKGKQDSSSPVVDFDAASFEEGLIKQTVRFVPL